MTIDLSGCRAKIKRADEHLNALYAEMQTFFEPYSNRRIVYDVFDRPWHIIVVRPLLDELPPLRLSLICGDAVHNLRTALDHLVWQLVLTEGNEPGKWNSFPIYSDPKAFTRDARSRKKKRGPGPLEGIDPNGEAWAVIEGAQPYRADNPRANPLSMLHELDVIDKHRTLLITLLFPDETTLWDLVGWNLDAELLDYSINVQPLSMVRETQILWLRFSEAGPDPQVRVKGNLPIQPTFGNPRFQVPADMIAGMYHYVSDFVESFE